MRIIFGITAAATLALASCTQSPGGPLGAPTPTHPEMTFVDGSGCYWWVIGNATSYSWARTTNAKGEHVCTEAEAKSISDPNPGVPFITPDQTEAPVEKTKTVKAADQRFVQVATFANADNARAAVARFKKRNLPVRPSSLTYGRGGFYRLVLGPFASAIDAETALAAARAEGFTDAFRYAR